MVEEIPLVIHATHEAGVKVGGIGAVLDGLLGAQAYNAQVTRSLLAGPMLGGDTVQMERLTSPGNRLTIRYSSLHAIFDGVDEATRQALQAVEERYQVALLYGMRYFGAYAHEVLLVEASNPAQEMINSFRYYIWRHYAIDSNRYSHDGEFNLYFAIAQPLFAAIKALGIDQDLAPAQKIILAHEWLGMPLVFAAQMAEPEGWRTVFYAHETATARRLVEEHNGHDTRFYNAMSKGLEWDLYLDNVFGDQHDLYKTPILHQAIRCDNILAVGDLVVDELRFMGEGFRRANMDLVYNGVPSFEITLAEKRVSKQRLQDYCRNLLGYTPDYVFTHVTRMVLSKALWRDIRVLDHLSEMLSREGRSAVLFVVSTSLAAGRRSEWVAAWESQYGWPVGHRGDNGDLVGQEAPFFFDAVEPFNSRSASVRVVLVNQFGWSQERCGQRMPAEMTFMDLRKGSDLEFGQSIYEPFGIAQVEPLSFGALCCVSSVCGCVGFVEQAGGAVAQIPNMVVADYVSLPPGYWLNSPFDALRIDRGVRDWIEGVNSAQTARAIFRQLPRTEKQSKALLRQGQELAKAMSWEVVARDYLGPSLRRAQANATPSTR